MITRSNHLVTSLFLIIVLAQTSTVWGQTFTIDPADGKIDPAWNSVAASIVDAYREDKNKQDANRTGDIINAWFVYEPNDPYNVYFRVDGFDLTDGIAVQLDCDGDGKFVSEIDRAVKFEEESSTDQGGEIVGHIDYTDGYAAVADDEIDHLPDTLDNPLTAKGEFVIKDKDNNFVIIEAVLSFAPVGNSSQAQKEKKPSNDVFREMAPCFGMRGETNSDWTFSYQYVGLDDNTGSPFSKDVRTAVTLSHQAAGTRLFDLFFTFIWLFLFGLTVSLLYVHSQQRRKNV